MTVLCPSGSKVPIHSYDMVCVGVTRIFRLPFFMFSFLLSSPSYTFLSQGGHPTHFTVGNKRGSLHVDLPDFRANVCRGACRKWSATVNSSKRIHGQHEVPYCLRLYTSGSFCSWVIFGIFTITYVRLRLRQPVPITHEAPISPPLSNLKCLFIHPLPTCSPHRGRPDLRSTRDAV